MAVLSSLAFLFASSLLSSTASANFITDVDVAWGDGRASVLDAGRLLTLSLDNYSGSGFHSKQSFLFSKIDTKIKLVPGNSAGTVTSFYLSSQGDKRDEIDFEFLGNETGHPYTLHTNIFAGGDGNREQQFRLWFDPTADFHTYSILWNPRRIIFLVDGIPIREYKNMESIGVPFPRSQPMKVYASIWNADGWATQGGRVKADWTKAPFTASFRDLSINSCSASASASSSSCGSSAGWMNQELGSNGRQILRWVQMNYMLYNYCADSSRFPQGFPKECPIA